MAGKPNGQHVSDEDVAGGAIVLTETLAAPEVLAVDAQARGEIDVQIATAKRFPRDITRFLKQAETLATISDDIAASCFYKLKRAGKDIEGPSVRFAEIVATAWGNIRIDARTVNEDARFVYAEGVAWDLERNNAIRFGTRRRITTKNGERYSDDMIATTANAAAAIALRNCVFRVVPKAFWEPIYEKAKEVAVGSAETLGARRQKMLDHFQRKYTVGADRLCAYLGVEGVEGIHLKHVEDLRGLATALKDGDAKVDDVFPTLSKTPEGAKATTSDEIQKLLEELPQAVRATAEVAFDELHKSSGQRLVLLRQHRGKPEALDRVLRDAMQAQATSAPAESAAPGGDA